MKKFIIFTLVICLSLSLCACGRHEEVIVAPHVFGDGLWYHVYKDQTSLQVLLEANPTTGYVWSYEISDPDILAAAFFDYAPDDAENKTGTGGVYGGSFVPTGSGEVSITFRHMRPWEDTPIETKVLEISVSAEGLVSVSAAYTESN